MADLVLVNGMSNGLRDSFALLFCYIQLGVVDGLSLGPGLGFVYDCCALRFYVIEYRN